MSKLPDFPVEGGCACDRVRYRLTAPPMNVYLCHCTDCQTITTSAFVEGAFVAPDNLEITQGRDELMCWERIHTTSGKRPAQFSCRHCGVRIYSQSRPELLTLRIGTLDDTRWLKPAGSIWMASAQPWFILPDGVLRYEDGGDFTAITAKWQTEWIQS
jgi:hypothetical protein